MLESLIATLSDGGRDVENSDCCMVGLRWNAVLVNAQVPDGLPPNPALTSALSSESKLVETWLNMTGHFNDRLLATVYWTLSVVGAVFVSLIGFGWYQNYRVYERDKSSMMQQLQLEMEKLSSSSIEDIESKLDAKIQTSSQQQKVEWQIGLHALEQNLESMQSRLSAMRKDLKRDIDRSNRFSI